MADKTTVEKVRIVVMLDYVPNLKNYDVATVEEAAASDLHDLKSGDMPFDEFFDDERTVITAVIVKDEVETPVDENLA